MPLSDDGKYFGYYDLFLLRSLINLYGSWNYDMAIHILMADVRGVTWT